jgi:hypothetical protein
MNDAERYDALLDAGREPAWPCPICTGDNEAEPCSEECAALVERVRRERLIESCRLAAKLVIKVAKSYQREGFPDDHRIAACIGRVQYYRGRIRELRRAA